MRRTHQVVKQYSTSMQTVYEMLADENRRHTVIYSLAQPASSERLKKTRTGSGVVNRPGRLTPANDPSGAVGQLWEEVLESTAQSQRSISRVSLSK